MQANNQIVSMLLGLFQKIDMTDVEQIESAGDVHNLIIRLWSFSVGELDYFLRSSGLLCNGQSDILKIENV